MSYETLLVNDQDVKKYVRSITTIDGLYNMATPRGDNLVFPGVDGEEFTDKPYNTTVVELGLILVGNTATEFNDALRALRTLIQPGRKLALKRHLSYSTGPEVHVADGEYASGLTPTVAVQRIGRTTLGLKVLSGVWYKQGLGITINSALDTPVLGETRTHRMTVTLPHDASIVNITTGHTLTMAVPSSVSTDPVTVDVERIKATQDGADVTRYMTFSGGRYPMRLVPGPNGIVGPSASITYWPAYL